jgi:hypothetical protein
MTLSYNNYTPIGYESSWEGSWTGILYNSPSKTAFLCSLFLILLITNWTLMKRSCRWLQLRSLLGYTIEEFCANRTEQWWHRSPSGTHLTSQEGRCFRGGDATEGDAAGY